MGYRIREITAESNFCRELAEMLERILPAKDFLKRRQKHIGALSLKSRSEML